MTIPFLYQSLFTQFLLTNLPNGFSIKLPTNWYVMTLVPRGCGETFIQGLNLRTMCSILLYVSKLSGVSGHIILRFMLSALQRLGSISVHDMCASVRVSISFMLWH